MQQLKSRTWTCVSFHLTTVFLDRFACDARAVLQEWSAAQRVEHAQPLVLCTVTGGNGSGERALLGAAKVGSCGQQGVCGAVGLGRARPLGWQHTAVRQCARLGGASWRASWGGAAGCRRLLLGAVAAATAAIAAAAALAKAGGFGVDGEQARAFRWDVTDWR